jgi:hypothetical protein
MVWLSLTLTIARNNYKIIRTLLRGISEEMYPHKVGCRLVSVAEFKRKANPIVRPELDFQKEIGTELSLTVRKQFDGIPDQVVFQEVHAGEKLSKSQLGYKLANSETILKNFSDEIDTWFPIGRSGPKFPKEKHFRSGLKYLVIQTTLGKKPIYSFKQFSKRHQPDQNGIVAVQRKGKIEKLTVPSFVFTKSIDFVYHDGVFFIQNQPFFEKISGYNLEIRALALKGVQKIVQHLPIDDPKEFEEKILNFRAQSGRAAQISGFFDPKKMTLDYCKERAAKFGATLPTSENEKTNTEQLALANNPQAKWVLLNTLDDSYFVGENSGKNRRATGYQTTH